MAKTALYLGILAFAAPYLYDRYLAFSAIFANRPSIFKPVYNIKSHEVKFRDRLGFRNCEDVVLDEAMGVAIVGCSPGRDRWNTVMGIFAPEKGIVSGGLWLYDYANPDLPNEAALKPFNLKNFPNADDFQPLGIEYDHSTSTLYVINHAQAGSVIEVFKIFTRSVTATHVQTFKHPLLHAPNSIHVVGDGKLFISNDHYIRAAVSPLLSKVETFSGAPSGNVVYVDIKSPETAKIVARLPFANGVTMINSTTLVVASSSKAGVYFFEVTSENDLKSKGYLRIPSGVDNISVDGNGKLLMAGHPYAFALVAVAQARPKCVQDSEIEEEQKACECNSPSWAAEWSQESGLRELYKGYDICTSSMVVRDTTRGVGMISALYDKGIMVFRE